MTTRSKFWSPLVGLSLVGAILLVDSIAVPTAGAKPRSSMTALVDPSGSINQIEGLTVEEGRDGTTTLRLQGTDKPTFNVYRLPDPDRLVVDVSRSKRGKVVPRLPLDTWAAGRLTVEDAREQDAQLVRLMVQLKRESSYIVVPDGHDLVVTITPREVPPEHYFARKSADQRREEIEAEKASARALKAEALALQRKAGRKADEAERRLRTAKQRAATTQRAEARAKAAEQAATVAIKEARTGKLSLRRELKRARADREQAEKARQEAEKALAGARLQVQRDRKAAKAARQRARTAEHEAHALKAEAQQTLVQAETEKREAARRLQAAQKKDKVAAQRLADAERERQAATRARQQAAQALAQAKKRSAKARTRRKLKKDLEATRAAEVAAKTPARRAGVSRGTTEKALGRAESALATERERVEAIQAQLEAKNTALQHARQQAEAERKSAVTARQDAQRARQTTTQVRARARKALAAAEQAIAQAQAETKAATAARKKAERALASARSEAAAAKQRGDQSHALEQAVTEARAQEKEARARQAQAQQELAELSADRDALKAKLEAQRKASARLEQGIEQREQRLRALEQEVTEARQRLADTETGTKDVRGARQEAKRLQATVTVLETQVERLKAEARQAGVRADRAEQRLEQSAKKGAQESELVKMRKQAAQFREDADRLSTELKDRQERLAAVEAKKEALSAEVAALSDRRSALAAQGQTLKAQNARARRELQEAESQLVAVRKSLAEKTDKLDRVEKGVEQAQARLDQRLRKLEATSPEPAAKQASAKPAKALARVTDVRFEDSTHEERVVIEVEGPMEYEGGTLAPTLEMIRLSRTDLPSSLERSLDTTRFAGPIKTVTSFAEGQQVKVIVSTRKPTSPVVEKRDGALVWRFPRKSSGVEGQVVSLAGTKVSGFTSSGKPKMVAPPKSSTPNRARSRWRGERIDIELQQAPIKDVLLLFSDIGRVNIIAGRGVEGVVTMKLTGVPWDQALDIILRSLNLGMVREGNVLRVATLKDLEDERREAIERAKAQVQLKPLQTRLVPVSYATAQEMQSKVSAVLSSRGSVTTDTRTNTLIVMDVAENIALAEELVGRLDSQTPQVLIEARIVEARTNFLRQLGIQWGFGFIASPGTGNPTGLLFPNSVGIAGGAATPNTTDTRGLILPGAAANPNYAVDLPAPVGTGAGGALGFSFGNINGTLQTNLRLSAAEDTGEVRIISAPKIVTLDNTAAQIEQGVQIPISQVSAQGVNTRYVNATLALKVTPHVTNEGAVLLDVTVQKNEADFINTGARGDPTILTKQAQSRMLVNDGDTAVIGGIYTRSKSVNFKKVPWIAEIPIIGWFFKSKAEGDTRTEVLIFLTPKIVNRASSIGG